MKIFNNSNFSQNNQTFTSRNSVIRRADDIARRINKVYPRISSSNVEDRMMERGFEKELAAPIRFKLMHLRYRVNMNIKAAKSYLEKIKVLPDAVLDMKVGNCAESAELAALAAKVNGIKNFSIRSVRGSDDVDFDHDVVYVRDRKPYIIDAWLGFADYLDGALERFKKDFGCHFDMNDDTKVFFLPYFYNYEPMNCLDNLSEQTLRRMFPELIVDKKQS